ncbi:hypothetical protein [Haloparvum sp. PAK95]|uniref:hypothetical protein n=1 Tax=Haloparvum sp. PAK95 TaxID=3418962 RepID=UPI003D2EFC3C
MTDEDDEELLVAAEAFLAATDEALSEYDQGYADADATLSLIESQLDPLREAVEEAEE